ncbi:unnamed protein product [Cladocopium goreaui]|uniref:Calcium/calmodulin-dependent protein kinase kinase 2 n=1 Tax=Cladocopium goreaui TaxID=2562237 RepID=A0A9P1DTM7_9DINO|nr:unnamed protein product [Cladocopium goreaui]
MTKLLLDPDMKATARIIAYVSEPESLATGMMFKNMRSAGQTREFYARWSHWSWLSTARNTLAVLSDLSLLNLIGFNVQFSGTFSPEALVTEDALAATLWKFMASLLSRRAGSNLWYTSGAGSTAGLLHPDPAKVAASLLYLRGAFKTMEIVNQDGSLAAKQALRGHCFTTPAMQWVFKALSSTGFGSVPDILLDYLQEIFSCLLNSKIIEDGNKLQREEETRSSNSKKVSPEQGWFLLMQPSLLHSYDRPEVSNKRLKHTPAGFDLSPVFQHHASREASEEEKLDWNLVKDITGKLEWPTHTPETEQQRAIVFIRNYPLYVLKTYKHACLVWPVTLSDAGAIKFDENEECLRWVHIHDIVDVQVASVIARCPRAMSETCLKNKGVCLLAGSTLPLLQWHAERGFHGVKEACLLKLNAALGFRGVTWGTDDGDAELALSVHLMLNLDPSLTEREGRTRAMRRCNGLREVVHVQEEELVETVVDCLLPSEQRKVINDIAEETQKASKMAKLTSHLSQKYKAALSALPKDRLKSGQERRKAKEKEENDLSKKAAAGAKERARVYADRNVDADKALKASLPRQARAWADDTNGRWRMTWVPTGTQKCISWTACGHNVAAVACLKYRWTWSEQFGYGSMPKDVANIVKKLES